MGLLLNGKWVPDDQSPPGLSPRYRNKLATSEFPFDPVKEPGRYHLYVSHSCPFAQRSVFARSYYGLESAIGISRVDPRNTDEGWSFETDKFPDIGDQILGEKYLKDVYLAADPNYTGRVTVPLLIDTKPGDHKLGGSGKIRIISAESADLVDEFEKVSRKDDASSQESSSGPKLMQSVFQAVKAQDESAKTQYIGELSNGFAKLGQEVSQKPYLSGNEIGNVDLKTFPFLLQVDAFSEIVLEKPPRVSDDKNLKAYAHRVYENPSIKKNVHLDQTRIAMFNKMVSQKANIVRNAGQVHDPEWISA